MMIIISDKNQPWEQLCSNMNHVGFLALTAQPAWLLALPAIRAELGRLSVPVVDACCD